jgi:uncharacterized protein with HEPN domain
MTGNQAPDYISHMLDAARLIISYLDEMSKDDFLTDTRTQQAVIFNIIASVKPFPNYLRIMRSC